MIAVVKVGGHQYIVNEKSIIEVDHQDQEVGATLTVEPLLIASEDGKTTSVGTPVLSGASVQFTVLEQFKDKKIRVFKMKSKKRHMRTFGFRAQRTRLQVTSIQSK